MDAVILDFENAEVRASDFDSLKPEGWLTGEIINFYWTYLERREFRTEKSVLFLGTYTAYRISNAENSTVTDTIATQLSGELGGERELILIPLNHRSHWSLLVYCRLTRTFYHYDSINRHNRQFAERAAGRLLRVLEPTLRDGFYFKSMQTPQQNNDFDCGIYVLAIAEELARRYINHRRRKRTRRVMSWQEQQHQPALSSTASSDNRYEMYQKLNGARDFTHDPNTPLANSNGCSSPAAASLPVPPCRGQHRHMASSSSSSNHAISGCPSFSGFGATSPFAPMFYSPSNTVAEPLLRGGGSHHQQYGKSGSGSDMANGHNRSSSRSRKDRARLESEMMERAGLPRDFWQVLVEDIEYPHCMRRRIRSLVLELGKV